MVTKYQLWKFGKTSSGDTAIIQFNEEWDKAAEFLTSDQVSGRYL